MHNVDDIQELSKPGVYCIESNEYAYFGYAQDILVAVSKVLSELRKGVFKIKDMEGKALNLRVLTELDGGDDIETLKLRCQYAARLWEEHGGIVWNPATKALLQYEVIHRVDLKRKCVNVYLLPSSSRTEKLVGSFPSIAEASAFIGEFYSPDRNPMMLPVYASNSLTKEIASRGLIGSGGPSGNRARGQI